MLTLKPTPPEELVRSRLGVLGALNMVADSLKLLPRESEGKAALDHRGMGTAEDRLAVSDFDSEVPRATVATHELMARHTGAAYDEPGDPAHS